MSDSQEVAEEDPAGAVARSNVCLIVLGMAGCGKTTFVQRLISHHYGQEKRPNAINLDPACLDVPYPANIA
jgi:GTPase SAR1 family protein